MIGQLVLGVRSLVEQVGAQLLLGPVLYNVTSRKGSSI